jgi:hypothetical protein
MLVVFAGFDKWDFKSAAPVLPALQHLGASIACLQKMVNPATVQPSAGCVVLSALPYDTALNMQSNVQTQLSQILNMGEVSQLLDGDSFVQLLGGRVAHLGWTDHYLKFVKESFALHPPNVAVLCPGEIESSIVASVCDDMHIPYCFFLPQFYEFNWTHSFIPHPGLCTFIVSGEFARQRLLARGVVPSRIVTTGNASFDQCHVDYADQPKQSSAVKTILYAMQGLPANEQLLQHLERFVSGRGDAKLLVRPHPTEQIGLKRRIEIFLNPNVKIDWSDSITEPLRRCHVFVTIHSMTLLDAFICGVPAICWESGIVPKNNPYAAAGDVQNVWTTSELETALNSALQQDRRVHHSEQQLKDRCERYLGTLDGHCADRIARVIIDQVQQETSR